MNSPEEVHEMAKNAREGVLVGVWSFHDWISYQSRYQLWLPCVVCDWALHITTPNCDPLIV